MKINSPLCIAFISICMLTLSLSAFNISIPSKTNVSKKNLAIHPPICPTDINKDGITNDKDVALLLKKFGQNCYCVEDVNGDGIVNSQDLSLILLNQDIYCRCNGKNNDPASDL